MFWINNKLFWKTALLKYVHTTLFYFTTPNSLPVTNEMLQPIMGNLTIEEAIETKKLYIVDLANLADLPCKVEELKNTVKIV